MGGAVWAVGGRGGNEYASQGGKVGMAVACGVAFLIGACSAIINFAYNAGGTYVRAPMRTHRRRPRRRPPRGVIGWIVGRSSASEATADEGNGASSGAVRLVDGLPVGVEHRRAGTLAASDNYLAGTSETVVQDPQRFEALIRRVFVPSYQPKALEEGEPARAAAQDAVANYERCFRNANRGHELDARGIGAGVLYEGEEVIVGCFALDGRGNEVVDALPEPIGRTS